MTTARLRCETLEAREVPAFLIPVTSAGTFREVGHFNADGKADLVVVDTVADTIRVRLGNGDGTFRAPGAHKKVTGIGDSVRVILGDFDADGKLDVVLNRGNALVTLRGKGDGTFRNPTTQTISDLTSVYPEGTADMNNDGRADLVVRGTRTVTTRFGPRLVTYLRVMVADSTPSFQQVTSLPIWQSASPPPDIHLGDLDGDGDTDVTTVTNSSNSAFASRALMNDGTGQLEPGNPVTGFDGANVTLADLDGNRKADLIRSNADGTSSVFLGNGSGAFTATEAISMSGPPVVADANGDSRPDLVYRDISAGVVKVFLGNGNCTFQSPWTFAAGPAPLGGVFVGDVDADGRPDLLLNAGSAQTSVLLNDGNW